MCFGFKGFKILRSRRHLLWEQAEVLLWGVDHVGVEPQGLAHPSEVSLSSPRNARDDRPGRHRSQENERVVRIILVLKESTLELTATSPFTRFFERVWMLPLIKSN